MQFVGRLVEKEFPLTILHVDFWKGKQSLQLNGLATREDAHCKLEVRDYGCVGLRFSFIWAYMDKAAG